MSLHKLAEQKFDAEIKKQLANASVPFDPESWDKMDQKLDRTFSSNGSGSNGIYGLLVLALLLSGLFFWTVGSFSKADSFASETNKISVDQVDNLSEGTVKAAPSSSNESSKVSESKGQDVLVEFETRNEKTDRRSLQIAVQENNLVKQSNIAANSAQLHSETADALVRSQGEGSGTELLIHTFLDSQGPLINWVDQPLLPEQIEEMELIVFEAPPVIKTNTSPWFLGFGFAPDISGVGSSELTKPGTNFNAVLEYRIGRRWSLQSGITYGRKNYYADGSDYNPPEGFWDYGVVPDATEATCEVLDIPINIRFYFNPDHRSQFFASTGISSYLMLTEEYYYEYENPNPHLVEWWQLTNENQHLFSIYNLSFGYQRSLNNRWYMEIEPFVKIPVAGVGFGEVDLWSTGMAFSLKYNFR